MRFDKAIGRNIARLRRGAGLTQEMLAARLQICGCDMTRSTLAKIEAGCRHIYAYELLSIKRAFAVGFDELFEGIE